MEDVEYTSRRPVWHQISGWCPRKAEDGLIESLHGYLCPALVSLTHCQKKAPYNGLEIHGQRVWHIGLPDLGLGLKIVASGKLQDFGLAWWDRRKHVFVGEAASYIPKQGEESS